MTPLPSDTLRRLLAWALTLAAFGWALALAAAPYLVTHSGTRRSGALTGATVYIAGSLLCHQRPARTFHLWGTQLPVCARCLGLYVGAALGTAVAMMMAFVPSWHDRQHLSPGSLRVWRRMLLAAAVPTAITALLEWGGRVHVSNGARAWAGAPLGAVVAWIVASGLLGSRAAGDRGPGVNCVDAHDNRRAAADK
ncbi:MAG: DUF2085 domain-containing protein [Acidobacteria bacterium]|nr:DUF2085 domain-containing protein [Acidobacteriota bacterium]